MPENEKPPARRVNVYYGGGNLHIIDASVDAAATGGLENPGSTIAADQITIQNSDVTTEVEAKDLRCCASTWCM